MEKTKIKAIELCYSTAGEICLGFFFIQDYLIFLKTFYNTLSENFIQLNVLIYRGELRKCVFKRTRNNFRTVKELVQTRAGINGVFTITILYDVSDIEKLRKTLNEIIYLNSMKIYYIGYSTSSTCQVIMGSSFEIKIETISSYLHIKEEIRYER